MKEFLFFFLGIFFGSTICAQGDLKNMLGLMNQESALRKQELPNLSTEEIKKLVIVNNGYLVFNKSTGCINYFFNNNWYEICGKCIPKFDRPVIKEIHPFLAGNEILLRDTGRYLALLFPDSLSSQSSDGKFFIKKPANYDQKKKYVIRISNLNESCIDRPVLDTTIHFSAGEAATMVKDKKSNYSFPVISAGTHFWLTEPLVTAVKNEEVGVKLNNGWYYNWEALNKDPLKTDGSKILYSAKVCPAGFTIPSAKEADELIEFNQKENITADFKLGKTGYVVPKNEKKEEPTDDRQFFMLRDSNHPEAFQALIIAQNEIRIATLPRQVYVKILCVSE